MDFPFFVEPVGPFHQEMKNVKYIFSKGIMCDWSPDSVVGIAAHCGLYDLEIESQWGARFSTPGQTSSGAHPTSSTMVYFPGVKQPGRGVDHPPSSSAQVKKRVELCLQFPSGPSWLVLV